MDRAGKPTKRDIVTIIRVEAWHQLQRTGGHYAPAITSRHEPEPGALAGPESQKAFVYIPFKKSDRLDSNSTLASGIIDRGTMRVPSPTT